MTFYKNINNKIKLIYHKAIKLKYLIALILQYKSIISIQYFILTIYKIKAVRYLTFISL